jgi:DNA mismatch repair protein MSH3
MEVLTERRVGVHSEQVVRLKAKHEGVLLMIEVGYKYRFFGEDAKVCISWVALLSFTPIRPQTAAKELGIVAYPDRNFIVASIPTHRRDIHLRK